VQIQHLLDIKPSRILELILREVVVWQLEHPLGTETECAEWLSEEWQTSRGKWEAAVPQNVKVDKRKRE
jgi:hypothetical protein